MNFVALDVETAQSERHSICQIGLVEVENGVVINEKSYLIKPPGNKYNRHNTLIHGINAEITEKAPTFDEVWPSLELLLEGKLLVAHNSDFDIDCLTKTLNFYELEVPDFNIVCTYKKTGKDLATLCQAYEIDLENHHDALCDAKSCAQLYLKILTNVEPDYSRVNRTARKKNAWEGHASISGDVLKPDLENGNPDSPFYGKKLVITGLFDKIGREEAAIVLKNLGADIDKGVTKKTNFAIVGREAGPSKIKRIEKYNSEGCEIKIVNESEFLSMFDI